MHESFRRKGKPAWPWQPNRLRGRPLFLVGKAELEDDLWQVCLPFMDLLK
jgi:hypothetical protein